MCCASVHHIARVALPTKETRDFFLSHCPREGEISRSQSLLSSAAVLAVDARVAPQGRVAGNVILFLLLLPLVADVVFLLVLPGRHPRVAVVQRSILAREIMALASGLDVVSAAGGERPGTSRKFRRDSGVLGDPVGQGIFAVLYDGLAGLVTVVGRPGLAGCDGGVVDQLEQVLAVAGDNGDLFAMLAQGVELVGVGGLDLLAGNVGQLGLSDERFGLGTDKFLLENDDLGRVGLLVFQVSDLVGDLLLSWGAVSTTIYEEDATGRRCRSLSLLGCTEASMFLMLLTVTRYWSYRSTYWSSSSPISYSRTPSLSVTSETSSSPASPQMDSCC